MSEESAGRPIDVELAMRELEATPQVNDLFRTWDKNSKRLEIRKDLGRSRGIQPACQTCQHGCKVLAAPDSHFTCTEHRRQPRRR